MIVSTRTSDGAACGWVGCCGNRVAVQLEVGHKAGCFGHCEAIGGVRGNFHAVLCPIDEGITFVGRSNQFAGLKVIVSTRTSDGAACGWVGCCGNRVAVQLEVGHKAGCFGHCEAIGGVRGNFHAVLCPIDEGVSFVGRSNQFAGFKVIVCACTSNGTACGRVGCCGNRVAVQLEVGHKAGCFGHCEAIGGVRGNFHAVLCPIDEGITFVGRSNQFAGLKVIVSTRTSDGAACGWVGCCGNRVAVQLEVGHKASSLGHYEAIGCVSGDHCAILRPVDESVALIGCCGQSTSLEVVEGACT